MGAALAQPVVAPKPVNWRSPRALGGLALSLALGAGLWTSAPQTVRRFEVDNAYSQAL